MTPTEIATFNKLVAIVAALSVEVVVLVFLAKSSILTALLPTFCAKSLAPSLALAIAIALASI